jgi:hypothetical protein
VRLILANTHTVKNCVKSHQRSWWIVHIDLHQSRLEPFRCLLFLARPSRREGRARKSRQEGRGVGAFFVGCV